MLENPVKFFCMLFVKKKKKGLFPRGHSVKEAHRIPGRISCESSKRLKHAKLGADFVITAGLLRELCVFLLTNEGWRAGKVV